MERVAVYGGPVEFEAVFPKIGGLSRDHHRLAYTELALVPGGLATEPYPCR